MNDQLNLWTALQSCGTCVYIRGTECIITRKNRRQITQETTACSRYEENDVQPMKTMTLRELGFRNEPKPGHDLQLLGFRNTTVEIGDQNNGE